MPHSSTRLVLASRPHGEPTQENFRREEVELPALSEGKVALQTMYLSLDPYMRGRMSDAPSYAPPVQVGQTMVGATVSRVVESADERFSPGDVVLGYGGWQTASVESAAALRRLDPDGPVPLSTALGVLGMPGFTAYVGLLMIGKPQAGETVAVAAATGPVGSAVGQIAKAKGCTTIGIAGGSQKVEYLRELGFDQAVDHRSETFYQDLKAAAPQGVDVYFENVGGPVWEAMMPRLNTFARVPVCGLIAGYNATEAPQGPDRSAALMANVLRKSLTLRGFIQNEFEDSQQENFVREMTQWVADGTVRYREDIVEGFDQTVEAFRGLLSGKNFGKLVIKVAD